MKISIIGLGLIGGSYALSLKQRFKNITLYGWDQNEAHNLEAKKRNIIDVSCSSLEEALVVGDWILLAIPVNSIASSLSGMLDVLASHQLIIDFGSTKEQICKRVARHKKRDQFIAAHPIAGTEYSGPVAALPDLFKNKTVQKNEKLKAAMELVEGDSNLEAFMKTLGNNGRLDLLPTIFSFFVDYASRRQNNVPVKVSVYEEPNEEIKNKVTSFVSQNIGHNTPIKYEINKTMLGGVVLKYKDNEIDLSVDNKLDGLNSVLTN